MRVLVVNAGSSSLKLSVLEPGDRLAASEELPAQYGEFGHDAVAAALDRVGASSADAVGHRVVHGGRQFTQPVRIDGGVRRALDELTDLAPLHQPKSLAGIDAVSEALPGRPAVACFDTAFHAGMPAAAAQYALPAAWTQQFGLRKFGFHGLSHGYAAGRAAQLLDRDISELRFVS